MIDWLIDWKAIQMSFVWLAVPCLICNCWLSIYSTNSLSSDFMDFFAIYFSERNRGLYEQVRGILLHSNDVRTLGFIHGREIVRRCKTSNFSTHCPFLTKLWLNSPIACKFLFRSIYLIDHSSSTLPTSSISQQTSHIDLTYIPTLTFTPKKNSCHLHCTLQAWLL